LRLQNHRTKTEFSYSTPIVLDHISLGVTDLERSRRFYDAVLRTVGIVRIVDFDKLRQWI
jgi:hypothetical protein